MPDATQKLIRRLLARNKQIVTRKQVWIEHWQVLSEIFLTRKARFTADVTPGEFLNKDLFDGTGQRAAAVAASTKLGMLWPSGAQSMKLETSDELEDSKENRDYFEQATKRLARNMDDPRAGLIVALDEYHLENEVFGTAGINIEEGEESVLQYKAWSVRQMSIGTGKDGKVNELHYDIDMEVDAVIETYKIENVSDKVRRMATKDNKDEKVRITIIIEPRTNRAIGKEGVFNMPWATFHIEKENKHLLKESGKEEFPTKINRMRKIIDEDYGRSAAMDALPDAQELNALREMYIVATEKHLDPAMVLLDDGTFGGGIIDSSSGAMNVLNISGKITNQNPLFPLNDVGELRSAIERMNQLTESISNHFGLDRLLDFNNETQMTLGEANIRDRLRNLTQMSMLSRQIAETYDPMVTRSFNISLRRGSLGVIQGSPQHRAIAATGEEPLIIPDKIARAMSEGKDVYKIIYFTPAARIMRADTVDSILRLWANVSEIAALKPRILDVMNEDETVRQLRENYGTTEKIINSKDDIEAVRAAQAQALEEQETLAGLSEGASIGKDVAQQEKLASGR